MIVQKNTFCYYVIFKAACKNLYGATGLIQSTNKLRLVCMYARSFRAVTESSSDSESLLSVLKLSFVCLRFAKIESALLVGCRLGHY